MIYLNLSNRRYGRLFQSLISNFQAGHQFVAVDRVDDILYQIELAGL